jgi:hypothetical protein
MGVRFMATAFGQITRNRRSVSGERNLRLRLGLHLENPKRVWGFCG